MPEVKTQKDKMTDYVLNVVLTLYFIGALFPVLWVFSMAFKTLPEILSWPPTFFFTPTLENFQSLFTGLTGASTGSSTVDFLRNFANSLVISFGAVVISVFVGVPATYAIARFNFKGKEDLAFTILSFRFAPELMVIIPIYIFFQRLGLLDTYTGLIWVYQLITLPMIVWILRGYIEDVSRELEEACWLDGYGRVHTFWRIVLPLIRPGIAASGLLAFIYAWNNFVFAVLLGGSRTAPVTVGAMQFISADALRYGDMAAAIVLAAIPALILALYAQKHLIRGLSLGAVKA
ncbi:MAG: carbohydrate ABC transporter permease [Spirochaeta sp.]|jgi:multiple sugar transport system permease protein|nr:carbohydrate ABC transporter permease [Spirochaeta sp.]